MVENDVIDRFITLRDVEEYHAQEWVIVPLRCHHGEYSALAWREVVNG